MGDETRWSDEELYRKHGEMTAVEVKHDKEDTRTPVVYRIRARLVPQCRVLSYTIVQVGVVVR